MRSCIEASDRGDSISLDGHNQVSSKDKLHNNISGTFPFLPVSSRRTATIQRGTFFDPVFLDRITLKPKHFSITNTIPYRETASYIRTKNPQGIKWVFKRIVAHREKSDDSLQLTIDWEGDYERTWKQRTNVSDKSV